MSESWGVKLDTAAMWSPDSLADSERFSLGGPSSVRGYPSASVLGDRGMFASVEGRYRTSIGDTPAYFSVFADGGYAARAHVAAGTADPVTLSSVGVGFSVMPTKWLIAQLIAAVPTGQIKDVDGHEKGRAWFSLTSTF
jgi:hemolysin activation/secretion protein